MRELIESRRDDLERLLARYGATNPMLFGSVAQGDAHAGSDIDILVEMDPADVFPVQLLKRQVSQTALDDAVPL